MPPKQSDLARELGLTVAAVSMALRNHPRIGLETRKRVQALARERGYVPNPAFSRRGALRAEAPSAGFMPVALVLQRNPSCRADFEDYQRELRRIAAGYGYAIQTHLLSREMGMRRLNEVLFNRGVEALLLGPVFEPGVLDELDWDLFSVVACEAGHYRPPCHLVMPDIGGTILRAERLVRARGYRRIGLVQLAEPREPVDHLDRSGAAAYLREEAERHGRVFEALDWEYGQPAVLEAWLARFRPDVVLGQTVTPYWTARDLGWPGGCFAFLSLRLEPENLREGFSGFIEDHIQTASTALRLLDGEIRAFERGRPARPTRILIDPDWWEGGTLERPGSVG